MIWALANDLLQRIVTLNKGHQRRNLSRLLQALPLAGGSKILDFGCGTALFAPVFRAHGLDYYGYDIDPRLLRYAERLYPNCTFVSDPGVLTTAAPFALIVANCCFHHIHDEPLAVELERLHNLLADGGSFLLIDLVSERREPWLRRMLMKLDQGVKVRASVGYRRLLERHFIVDELTIWPQPSGPWPGNPLFLDLAICRCRKRRACDNPI